MEEKIQTLVELLKETAEGKCAIALAGAHAKEMADSASDIDLYIFAERAKPRELRLELIRSIADPGTMHGWTTSMPRPGEAEWTSHTRERR